MTHKHDDDDDRVTFFVTKTALCYIDRWFVKLTYACVIRT